VVLTAQSILITTQGEEGGRNTPYSICSFVLSLTDGLTEPNQDAEKAKAVFVITNEPFTTHTRIHWCLGEGHFDTSVNGMLPALPGKTLDHHM
jgi:hypothetical protein